MKTINSNVNKCAAAFEDLKSTVRKYGTPAGLVIAASGLGELVYAALNKEAIVSVPVGRPGDLIQLAGDNAIEIVGVHGSIPTYAAKTVSLEITSAGNQSRLLMLVPGGSVHSGDVTVQLVNHLASNISASGVAYAPKAIEASLMIHQQLHGLDFNTAAVWSLVVAAGIGLVWIATRMKEAQRGEQRPAGN